jgi:hypothetical protein
VQDALQWLKTWERLINETDYQSARELFARDVISFGTLTGEMSGLDELEYGQWRKMWPTIRNFRFCDPIVILPKRNLSLWIVICRWNSEGKIAVGGWYDRQGRSTLALEGKDNRLLCIHSHFSMEPGTPASQAT